MAELTGGGLNLRRADASVHFWIARGWLDEPAEVRGKDDIIPGAEGQVARGRKRTLRKIELRGQIAAVDGTDASFLALLDELRPIFFDASADPWPLVAADGYRGLGVGETATINVRTVNVTPSANPLTWRGIYAIELESVDSPPEWVRA